MINFESTLNGIKAIGIFMREASSFRKDLKTVPDTGFPDRSRKMRSDHSKHCLESFGIPYSLPDREQLYKHTPCIFVCNHLSFLDAILVSAAFDEDMRILFKSTLLHIPGFPDCVKKEKFIPVIRGKGALVNLNIREKIASAVEEKANIVFFPEGTRSKDGSLGPFKLGAFYAAIQHQLPVVPLLIRGTREALPKKTIQLQKVPISLTVLDAIFDDTAPDMPEKEKVMRLADRAHQALEDALGSQQPTA